MVDESKSRAPSSEKRSEREREAIARVSDALDEAISSRPKNMWEAFWDGFKRA